MVDPERGQIGIIESEHAGILAERGPEKNHEQDQRQENQLSKRDVREPLIVGLHAPNLRTDPRPSRLNRVNHAVARAAVPARATKSGVHSDPTATATAAAKPARAAGRARGGRLNG